MRRASMRAERGVNQGSTCTAFVSRFLFGRKECAATEDHLDGLIFATEIKQLPIRVVDLDEEQPLIEPVPGDAVPDLLETRRLATLAAFRLGESAT